METKLEFYKDYLIQTRKEIDLEKTEGTRILHLKIILLGAILAFMGATKGFWLVIPVPFLLFALDHMQTSRLRYILDRWKFLAEEIVPKLKTELADNDVRFFEEEVWSLHSQKDVYFKLESLVRTLMILPTTCAASIVLGAILLQHTSLSTAAVYWVTLVWFDGLVAFCAVNPRVYRRYLSIVVGAVLSAFLIADLLWIDSFSSLELVQALF